MLGVFAFKKAFLCHVQIGKRNSRLNNYFNVSGEKEETEVQSWANRQRQSKFQTTLEGGLQLS